MIQVIHIKNKENTKDEVYIGRPSILGNPFDVKTYGRTESLKLYRQYAYKQLNSDTEFRRELMKLVDRHANDETITLVCFCKPMACHGDILKELIQDMSVLCI